MYEGQMITSGLNNSGNVILAPEKKSHKKWIVVGVIALVIIVIFLVMFLIPRGKGNVSGDGKAAFNRYANYLLYGNDSTDVIKGKYEDGFSGKLNSVLEEESSTSSTFAQNMEALWGDFIKKSNDFAVENDLTRDNYGQRVGFMVTYLNNYSSMSVERIIEIAQNNPDEKIEEVFDEYFALYDKYDFNEAKSYITDSKSYFQSIVNWVKELGVAGCNSGNVEGIVEECNEIYGEGEDYILDYLSYSEGAIYDVANYLIKNAWTISVFINGGSI